MKRTRRTVALKQDIQCGIIICAYKKPGDGRICLCEHYSHRSRVLGFCNLTKENLVVHRMLDGVPIAKRGWKCLEAEHLWEKFNAGLLGDQVLDENGATVPA